MNKIYEQFDYAPSPRAATSVAIRIGERLVLNSEIKSKTELLEFTFRFKK